MSRTRSARSRSTHVADYPFFDNGGRPIPFAHRGGALTGDHVGLENSMAAFEAAIAMGYRHIETDVHSTRDGAVVAFHDTTLDRITDRTGRLDGLDHADLARALVGGREAIPLLSDILTAWPELRLNIDAKADAAVVPLARCIDQHHAWDRVCVASFSPRRLHQLRKVLDSRVATAYSAFGVGALRLLPSRRLRGWAVHHGQAAQVPPRRGPLEVVTTAFVERAHDLGKQVHVWTIDDAGTMQRLLDLGVDAIMSDRIDVLREVFESRGIWQA
ncbi:MAG TPA: glycerophosphodiester phosphodiesterase family protein [Nocardioidaceae bacterium]